MNIDTAFPNKYLKESDLQGGTPTVTIAKVTIEEIGQGTSKERKPVIYFEGKAKGMVCNKTNAAMIAKIAGSRETDDWLGKKIRLISAEVEFQGELTRAIRVRELSRNGAAQQQAPSPPPPVEAPDDDDIPF